jgi:hypothetical protein
VISLLENVMLVVFINSGVICLFFFGVVVCSRISLFNLLSRFLYLICIIFFSFSSIVCWIYDHVLPHALAMDKCKWYNWQSSCCFVVCHF